MPTPNKYMVDVQTFHLKFEADEKKIKAKELPIELPDDLFKFRLNFLKEEFAEFGNGLATNDIAECADALIDLVYVTCGTALKHRVNPNNWPLVIDFPAAKLIDIGSPALAQPDRFKFYQGLLTEAIAAYEAKPPLDQQLAALVKIYHLSFSLARVMGITQALWDELWDDVQAANMRKVKATRDNQSKRGSAKFDIVKPEGWVGPKTREIIEKALV